MSKFEVMGKFDFVQLIGKQTCDAASHLTGLLSSEPACASAEVWNMGVYSIVATLIVLAVLVIRGRLREDNN
jgi:hypothetical protein